MSQFFEYFVCSRPVIERWADALERHDEELRESIEDEMARSIGLKNVGQDEFNILAHCVDGDNVDMVKAVGEVDLVRAVSEDGPWVLAFRQPAVEAIAGMVVDPSSLKRWVKAVAAFNGTDEVRCQKTLTAHFARTLKDICRCAITERLCVFTCFYGR